MPNNKQVLIDVDVLGTVRYDEDQDLTTEQQERIKNNIGLAVEGNKLPLNFGPTNAGKYLKIDNDGNIIAETIINSNEVSY